jgi:type IV pilus assembly protein PilX
MKPPFNSSASSRTQRGAVLVIALLILLLLTTLGVAMFRSFGLQERIAGNTREKQHAFQAAQSALQFGEWWLTQGNAGTGTSCTGPLAAATVCSNAATMATLTGGPWSIGSIYTPINVNGVAPMTISATGGVGTYFAAPRLYINYLGLGPSGQARVYQVTAIGNGGDANSVAVVQSTYSVTTGIKDLGGL